MIIRKLILIVFWLTLFPEFSFASGNWDVHPTPLERLEEAGVATDVSSVSEVRCLSEWIKGLSRPGCGSR